MNFGSSDPPEQCSPCENPNQLCDEEHQQVPKPAVAGVYIDPANGDAIICEPYVACIKHTTVEGVLSEECTEGYMVRAGRSGENAECPPFRPTTHPSLSPSPSAVLPACRSLMCRHLLPLQGWACNECAPSFYRDDDKLCQKCNSYVWVLYIVGFLAALVAAPMLTKVAKSRGFMSVNIFVGTMQVSIEQQPQGGDPHHLPTTHASSLMFTALPIGHESLRVFVSPLTDCATHPWGPDPWGPGQQFRGGCVLACVTRLLQWLLPETGLTVGVLSDHNKHPEAGAELAGTDPQLLCPAQPHVAVLLCALPALRHV